MSRIIQQKTEITDKDLAIRALKQAGITYVDHGETLRLTSGVYSNATLHLKTGTISGDSDFGHTENKFGLLRQFYSEAKIRAECAKTGTCIDERTLDKENNIVLLWHTA